MRRLLPFVVVALLAPMTGATAAWHATAEGSATGRTVTLAGSGLQVQRNPQRKPVLTWNRSLPSPTAVRYVVTRNGVVIPNGECESDAGGVSGTTCTDTTEPGNGPSTYTVQPVYERWTGTRSAAVTG